jgi:hypothetical protein
VTGIRLLKFSTNSLRITNALLPHTISTLTLILIGLIFGLALAEVGLALKWTSARPCNLPGTGSIRATVDQSAPVNNLANVATRKGVRPKHSKHFSQAIDGFHACCVKVLSGDSLFCSNGAFPCQSVILIPRFPDFLIPLPTSRCCHGTQAHKHASTQSGEDARNNRSLELESSFC